MALQGSLTRSSSHAHRRIVFEVPSALDDPETSAAVRRGRRRAFARFAGGAMVLTLAVVLINVASDRQRALVRDGTVVQGLVIDAEHPFRGPNLVTYRYVFEGQRFFGSITGSGHYRPGEVVTVFVDPDRPERSTLPGEQPQSDIAYWVTVFAFVLGSSAIVSGMWSLMQWRWRVRVLRSSPWAIASVLVLPARRPLFGVRLKTVRGSEAFDLTSSQATRLLPSPVGGSASVSVRTAARGRRVVISSPRGQELALGRRRVWTEDVARTAPSPPDPIDDRRWWR